MIKYHKTQGWISNVLLLWILTSAFVLRTTAQNSRHIDSLLAYVDTASVNTAHVQNLLNIGYHYTYSTPFKAEPFLIKADSIAHLMPRNDRMNAVIESYFSILYEQLAQYEEAIIHIDSAIMLFEKSDVPQYQAISIQHKGKILGKMNRDDLAHQAFTEAGKIFEEIGDQKYLNEIALSLGNVNFRMNNKDKAFEYYETARDSCLKYKNYNCWETASNNIAVIYTDRHMADEAMSIYNNLEEYYLENGNENLLAKTYYNMAEVWDEVYRDDIKSAKYSKKSLDIRLKLGNVSNIIDSRLDYGRNMVRLKNYESARIHLNEGLSLAKKLGVNADISNAHRSLAQLYEGTREYKKAYESLKIHKTLKDTLKNNDVISRIAELETKYQTAKKEQEIALLESQQNLAQQTISSQKRINFISILGGSILALLSAFLYSLFRQNRDQKKQLQIAVEAKDYLLREIHHRVKNNLQVISSLLYLQSEQLTDPAAQDAINVGRGRVKSMALIHQNLYGVNQSSEINLKKYLEDLAVELFDSYNLRGEEIELDLDIEDVSMDVEKLVPLGLILNELISNSLKYAYENKPSGRLFLGANVSADNLVIQVVDDGIGIENIEKREGSFGTELIQSFSDQLDAEISTVSENGTHITLSIPLVNSTR